MVGVAMGIMAAAGAAGQLASGLLSAQARQGEFNAQIRALSLKRDQTLGIARAKAAASGTTLDSTSTQMYLAGLANEFDVEIAGVKSAKKTAHTASMVSLLTGIPLAGGDIYGKLGQANNWWQDAPAAEMAKTNSYSPGSGQPLWR